ncbi:MAG: DUF4430 domain-containing protein [Solirubrobacteraceae bacterium]
MGATVALVLSFSAASLAAAGPQVTVRVEGRTHTLLAPTKVQTHTGSITIGGAPKGACPATSAAGALDVATQRRFSGPFDHKFNDYFIKTILGEFESGKSYFWEVFVDDTAAQAGACALKLHRGEQLLFAAVPASGSSEEPIVLSGPRHGRAGQAFTVKVVFFNAKGVAKPLSGARVYGADVSAVTNRRGIARIDERHPRSLVLHATPHGYIRAVTLRVSVTR